MNAPALLITPRGVKEDDIGIRQSSTDITHFKVCRLVQHTGVGAGDGNAHSIHVKAGNKLTPGR